MEQTGTSTAVVFEELTHYAGFDWAKDRHQIAVVDGEGRFLLELSFENTAAGWTERPRVKYHSKRRSAFWTNWHPRR